MILPRTLALDSEAEVDRLCGRSHSYASLGHSDDDGVPEPGGQPLFARAAARAVDGTPGAGATVWGAVRVLLFTLMVVMLALMSGANEEPLTEAFARSPPSGGGGGGAAVLGRTLSAFVITTNDSSPRALSTRALLRNLSFGDVQLQRARLSLAHHPRTHSLHHPHSLRTPLTPHTWTHSLRQPLVAPPAAASAPALLRASHRHPQKPRAHTLINTHNALSTPGRALRTELRTEGERAHSAEGVARSGCRPRRLCST